MVIIFRFAKVTLITWITVMTLTSTCRGFFLRQIQDIFTCGLVSISNVRARCTFELLQPSGMQSWSESVHLWLRPSHGLNIYMRTVYCVELQVFNHHFSHTNCCLKVCFLWRLYSWYTVWLCFLKAIEVKHSKNCKRCLRKFWTYEQQ